MRRRGMPLMRAAAVTTVVAGTAGAVHHHQNQKYAQQDYQQQQDVCGSAGVAAPRRSRRWCTCKRPHPRAARPRPAAPDLTAQLQQLAQLHNAGVLSDEEFAQAKQKLLAG